ncbi:HAMP domain-containing sensor histidine kinase [Cryobacterium sp. PH31-AA6]|uniref:sensor histidine kinase n=1 Tax=Cryobacterium sp. PH31-AA6 TaxID=3046205 RepID=UPI0024BA0285|nr:HAMP domain-containing sensor histidine kinase [Cryobacterium sp. PH31-AA6]MDJ0322676.1 HAMP domain-containing sensor histidine kinase [Cryobacterium sp. PH31-AA6]
MIFRRALIRLTLTYTVVQLLLFGGFALGIYGYVTGTFDLDSGERNSTSITTAEQGFANLRVGLIVGYSILVILLPLSSYLMARTALIPIRRSYDLQQSFVEGASHEFRSPLSVIQGELELGLSRSRTPAEYRAAMATSLDAVGSLIRLTNDLLLLTRDDPSELEATFERVLLTDIVDSAVGVRASAGRDISVTAHEPLWVIGSAELLGRAAANVLDNAIKFTASDKPIRITVRRKGKFVQLIIEDHGVGLTPAEIDHAFDRFWRAPDARATPGHGLGLSLVKQICAAHHGHVSLQSKPGEGTTVMLTIPAFAL